MNTYIATATHRFNADNGQMVTRDLELRIRANSQQEAEQQAREDAEWMCGSAEVVSITTKRESYTAQMAADDAEWLRGAA